LIETSSAFAALKANGLIKVWGDQDSGGRDAPTGKGYTKIYSTDYAFAALKANGSIKAWGDPDFGGERHMYLNKSWYNLCQWVHFWVYAMANS
jgi:hypothetical protein